MNCIYASIMVRGFNKMTFYYTQKSKQHNKTGLSNENLPECIKIKNEVQWEFSTG